MMFTDRLELREINIEDAEFISQLVQEPQYIENIRNTGVTTVEEARQFIVDKFLPSYQKGYGFYLIREISSGRSMGICGLIKRDGLPGIDIGYALHSAFQGQGFAIEAAKRTLDFARDSLKLDGLLAITKPTNLRSMILLEKLGFTKQGTVTLPGTEDESTLFKIHFL